jgi:mitochondrial fission protein ELM1
MNTNSQVTCWVVTDGKAGMENQCLGLAEALNLNPVIKRIKLRSPWRELSPFLRLGLPYAFSGDGDPVALPFPDLLIATGRHSIPASLYARRETLAARTRTLTVQLQNPVIDPSRFDLVVVPRHDGLTGPNVMTTRGALHRVTPEMLKREAEKFLPTVAHLPSPRIAVLIGGSNAVYHLTPREIVPLTQQLASLVKEKGGSLMITPSRRTGAENLSILQSGLKDSPAYIWDGQGDNPYYGMLGLADIILVTCDSVNMVSEACTTGKPVYVIDLAGGSDKFRRFHQSMRDDGLTRPFTGSLEPYSYEPLNDVGMVADRIRQMLAARHK